MDETKKYAPKVVFKCLNPPIHKSSGAAYVAPARKRIEDPKKEHMPDSFINKDKERTNTKTSTSNYKNSLTTRGKEELKKGESKKRKRSKPGSNFDNKTKKPRQ